MSTTLENMQDAMTQGWKVLPLPRKEKASPPKGTTGRNKRFLEEEEAFELATEQGNYGISLEKGVIGLDFDLYKDATTLTHLEEKLGRLPQTVGVSSKTNPTQEGFTSFFTVPTDFESKISYRNMDVIQYHHRYSVAGGSTHPTGNTYQWLLGEYAQKHAPGIEMLAELPQAWQEFLYKKPNTTEEEPSFETTTHTEDLKTMCAGMRRTLTRASFRSGSRHDAAVKALWSLARQRSQGCQGFEAACEILFQQWLNLFNENEQQARDLGAEFLRAKQGATNKNPIRNTCNCWRQQNQTVGVTRGLFM